MVCQVEVEAVMQGAVADDVFLRISSFGEYAKYTDAVRSIEVTWRQGDILISDWSVNFRGGVLEWTERDELDEAGKRIYFKQTEGDFVQMHGKWLVTDQEGAVQVKFWAEFDMGIPTLEPIINPVAMRALKDNIGRILRGLLGDNIELTSTSTDLALQPGAVGG
ncbi:type II toxin-antitoxin system RatA family toxin [Mycobacteroides abscessus]|uniref:type II toxin-antitoxin system RatA family toxin n=1 Tax=Mycobacteroides abscessus TaxID=36809 RepID=UPI000C2564AA|nr:SRPBCC family protein [Mycobacteroides abscessus]